MTLRGAGHKGNIPGHSFLYIGVHMRFFNLTFWIAFAPIRISSCLLLLESFFSEVAAANKNSEEEKEAPTRFYT